MEWFCQVHPGNKEITLLREQKMRDQDDADCLTLTIPEAAKRLGLSRNGGYEAARSGEIPSIKIGKRILVPKVALERLLAGTTLQKAN